MIPMLASAARRRAPLAATDEIVIGRIDADIEQSPPAIVRSGG
jgi:hypothetical protein